MRAKNILIPTLVSLTILAGCDGAEDRKLNYIEQAEQSFDVKDYEKAKLGYKNAIQIDPKDIDARIGLAKTMVADKDWRGAAGQYTGVLEIDENHRLARLELGKLFLLARATDQAKEHAKHLLEMNPEDIDALTLQAGILSQEGKVEEALKILDTVFSKAPGNIDTAVLYASLLLNSKKLERTVDVVQKAQAEVEDSVDLHLVLVQVYALQKNHDLAIKELETIIRLRPDVFEHKKRLVQYYLSIDKTANAVALLESVVETSEGSSNLEQAMAARQALVDLHVKARDFDRAIALLDRYIKDFPNEFELQLGKARLNEVLGEKDAAKDILQAIVDEDDRGPFGVKARVELARIELSEGHTEAALDLLNKVLEDKPGTIDALRLRGQITSAQKQYDDAVNDFRVVLKADPDDAGVQRALADVHFKMGEYRLSETYLKQLRQRFPQDLVVIVALAEVSAKLGKLDTAIALREEVLLYEPNESANLVELAKLYANANNIDGLRSTAALLQNTEEGKLSGIFFEGMAFQATNEHGKAIERFDAALALNEKAIEPLSAKTKSLIALGRSDQAIQWLNGLAKSGENSLASNLLGETLLLTDQKEKALDAFSKAISSAPQWLTPYRNKALTYKAQNDLQGAMKTLKAALDENPGALDIQVELAQLLEAQGRIEEAIETYEEIYESSNGSMLAANNLAMLLITYREDEASLQRAGQVAETLRGSTNPAFMDTLGWVYVKQGQIELAIPLIEEAAKRVPDAPQINYHLGYAYNEKQDFEKAILHIEKALKETAPFVGRSHAEALQEQLSKRG